MQYVVGLPLASQHHLPEFIPGAWDQTVQRTHSRPSFACIDPSRCKAHSQCPAFSLKLRGSIVGAQGIMAFAALGFQDCGSDKLRLRSECLVRISGCVGIRKFTCGGFWARGAIGIHRLGMQPNGPGIRYPTTKFLNTSTSLNNIETAKDISSNIKVSSHHTSQPLAIGRVMSHQETTGPAVVLSWACSACTSPPVTTCRSSAAPAVLHSCGLPAVLGQLRKGKRLLVHTRSCNLGLWMLSQSLHSEREREKERERGSIQVLN